MAIELRKKDVLSRLQSPGSSVRFVPLSDRWDMTNR
jgi:hypothetical protein